MHCNLINNKFGGFSILQIPVDRACPPESARIWLRPSSGLPLEVKRALTLRS